MREAKPKPKVETTRQRKSTRSSATQNAARKAANNRRAEREARLRSQNLKRRLRSAAIVLGAVLLCAGAVMIYRSDLFSVDYVEILGADHLTDESVRDIAGMPMDATLIRFPADEVRSRLESDPWIAQATVTRDFPDTARIRIVERVPVALVDVGDEYYWLVDEAGYMIVQGTPDSTSTVPVVIRDIPGLDPIQGKRTTSEPLLNVLDVWSGLTDELRSGVRAITAESIDKTTLIMTDGVWILVGSAEDIEKKSAVAAAILEEQPGEIVYINVRTVDVPTIRKVGDE